MMTLLQTNKGTKVQGTANWKFHVF
jgi:hypothetical protein